MAQREPYNIPLGGGLDLATPALRINPGRLIGVKNYEPVVTGGHARMQGYESFDGQPSPSEATYSILNFDAGGLVTAEVAGVASGVTSGASGTVGVVSLASGSWAGGTAAGFVVLHDVTGTFQDNETIHFTGADDEYTYEYSSEYA